MNYAAIRHYDIANGEGVRTSLFVSGCYFHCPECFNPEQQDFDYGQPLDLPTCANIINSVREDVIAGLSLLGGDPLCQDEDGLARLIALCMHVHILHKTVWLWSGYTWEQVFADCSNELLTLRQDLVRNSDVFVDGTFQKEFADRALKWRGSANQRVIDVKATLQQEKIILYEG